MSVLLVIDDGDDDIRIPKYEHPYRQIKELQYKLPFNKSSFSIVVNSKFYHRRRRSRPEQCLVKHLLTYMIALLFLINNLNWSIIFVSLSSFKFMSTYASSPEQFPRSTKPDLQKCSKMNKTDIEQICSKTSRVRWTPYEESKVTNRPLSDFCLPFCSNLNLQYSVNQTQPLNETSEETCKRTLTNLSKSDAEAEDAYSRFLIYMQAIDSASNEDPGSKFDSCQKAYRIWTCSVNVPYFLQNHRILPCQTICDEVERFCPTLRPSDREPLFAGQPLFFCNGGIVSNSDYGKYPHCFDTCHVAGNSSQYDHSNSLSSNKTSSNKSLNDQMIKSCFKIEPLPSLESKITLNPLIINASIISYTNETSTSSALAILPSPQLSINVNLLTFISIFLLKILQES